jgi:hypothetical protein
MAQKLILTFYRSDERVTPPRIVLARTKTGEYSLMYLESIHQLHYQNLYSNMPYSVETLQVAMS